VNDALRGVLGSPCTFPKTTGSLESNMLIGLYGAGTLGRRIGRSLKRPFIFVDDTPEKAGTLIDHREVVTLKEFAERASRDETRLYVCIYQVGFRFERKKAEIDAAFPGLDSRPFTELLLSEAADALPFLFFERPEALREKLGRYEVIHGALADDLSRATLDAHVKFRLSGRFDDLVSTPRHDIAFLSERLSADIGYVDAGAFDGDTAEDFIKMVNGRFRHIWLVEPDPANAARAERRLAALDVEGRVTIQQAAVSSSHGLIGFNAMGSVGSSLDLHSEYKVPTVMLSDFEDDTPLYFKLDIEGAEVEAIRASLDFITRQRVFLGVSVYHAPDDLLEIASMIDDLDIGYQLFIRCHGGSGEDLMLYAVPPLNAH
jgi:FkbM family methyltransferase